MGVGGGGEDGEGLEGEGLEGGGTWPVPAEGFTRDGRLAGEALEEPLGATRGAE